MNRENMSTIGAADDVVINVGKITLKKKSVCYRLLILLLKML